MENNKTTYLTIGVTAIAGVIGLLGWHTYNNSSYETVETVETVETSKENVKIGGETETKNPLNLKMSTPSFLHSFWKSEYNTQSKDEEEGSE